MVQFTNSFTGKGTGIVLPSGEGLQRSQERMSDMILNAEKLKYETFKKNSEEFLKMMDVDPVLSISNAATEYQQGLISEFINYWGKESQKVGGNFSDSQKIQIMKERRFIEAEGSKIQSMQKAWETEDALVKKNPIDFDEERHVQKTLDFLNKGHFDYNDIPWRAKDFASYIQAESQKNKNEAELEWKNRGSYEEEVIPNVPKGSEGAEIERMFHNAPEGEKLGFWKAYNEWKTTNPEEYKRLFDINKDNVVSPQEAKNINPIMEWAKTYPPFLEKVVTYQRTGRRRPVVRAGGNDGTMRTWGGQKYTPTSAMQSPYVGLPSDTYHPYTNLVKQMTIPVANMELLEEDKATTEKPNQSIKGFVTGYDENSDKIIFVISKDYKDLDYPTLSSGAGMQVAVPRSDFSKEIFDNLEIVKDGKFIKLKDITTSPVTTSPDPWDKYKRKRK